MLSFFSGGSSGAVKFSGLSATNVSIGVTLSSGNQTTPSFVDVQYDTDSYLTNSTTITFPRTGYYRILFGFVSDAVFVGKWELVLSMGTNTTTLTQGATISSELAEGQVVDEAKCNAGDTLTYIISQTSSANQLVYPYIRVSYLGS